MSAAWALDRSALWNAAEAAEKRKDARVAREFEVALPHELDGAARAALALDFAQDLADRYGAAVDVAVHRPHTQGDERNHHAHLLMTTRQVTAEGLGEKTTIERRNALLNAQGLPAVQTQLREVRALWAELANEHLARAGLEARIDHRSHAGRGIEIAPTKHVGVQATQMERRGRGEAVQRTRLEAEDAARNAERIGSKPEAVLEVIGAETSVFDKRDIARALHRYLPDDAAVFRAALARVMASPELVEVRGEDAEGAARYATRAMVALEGEMAVAALRLAAARDYAVAARHVRRAVDGQERTIQRATGRAEAGLSAEQKQAVAHVAGAARIAVVVGRAGAGKSTMLAAAKDAWERQGYRVRGAALAGKAVEGLAAASGIQSRTLASWTRAWEGGFERPRAGDVLVVDEAGMLGSRQMAGLVEAVERAGAKLVLVGDPEQLQAIGAGAPLRAIAERVGVATLEAVRRQREAWQRDATTAFATGRTGDGLRAYAERGAVRFEATGGEAQAALVRDYLADRVINPEGTRLALAHRRVDVAGLNEAVREGRKERGELAGERVYRTDDGRQARPLAFAAGDRLVFLANERAMGVKNGTLGTVTAVAAGRIEVRLDDGQGEGQGRTVAVDTGTYRAFDHGYATTIHKSQGATVDKGFVLASASMDRHTTYVAMSRHREAAGLYAGRDQFPNAAAMTERLGRSGAKETTLDYAQVYAERRGLAGLAASLGLMSRIEVTAPSAAQAAARDATPEGAGKIKLRAGMFDGLKLPVDPTTAGAAARAMARGAARDDGLRPGMFDGLKLPTDPNVAAPDAATREAERLMRAWRGLEARQGALEGIAGTAGRRAEIIEAMRDVVRAIEADLKVAAAVAARGTEIGIAAGRSGHEAVRAMTAKIERGQSRGRDRGMER